MWLRIILLAVILSFGLPNLIAEANVSVPYYTYSADSENRWFRTQPAYVPAGIIDGLNAPEDLFIGGNDEIYVADAGSNRIIQLDGKGKVSRTLPLESDSNAEAQLSAPEGVFVAESGEIFVADTGKRRIAVFGSDGIYLRAYKQPDSQLLPKNYLFFPSKIVVDLRGYMYIANKGGYQGLLLLTEDGEFVSFYGANKVPSNFLDSLKRRFFTEEQLREEEKKLPGAVTNMAIEEEGFIYTVNRDLKKGQIKRLNSGGTDLLGGINFAPGYEDYLSFQDIHIDANDMMTAIAASGHIYQYDALGNLIFRFGRSDTVSQKLGLFKNPTSLVMDTAGTLYVSDRELNMIQVFRPTEFGKVVHAALALYGEGKYEEAVPLWKRIGQLNGKFDKVHQGLGKAEYRQGDYETAMNHFELARDREGYSESYWQVRMESLAKKFGPAVSTMLLLAFVWKGWSYWRKRGEKDEPRKLSEETSERNHWLVSLRYVWTIFRHPVNGMYELATDKRAKWQAAVMILVLGWIASLTGTFFASFLFRIERPEDIRIAWHAAEYFVPVATWIAASYLIGSVMKGEATFRQTVVVNGYAMVPFILFKLPVQLLSNVLTLQESIVYDLLQGGIWAWALLLMFLGLMYAQNYNLKESLGMSAVSLFTMACIWVFGILLFIVMYQAFDFLIQIGREWSNHV